MNRLLFSIAAALALPGAAIAKKASVDPAAFSGAAGWTVIPGSTRITSTAAGPGGFFAEQAVRYVRTGIFENEVISGGSIAKETIRAGAPAYAVEMIGYGVGWCTPGGEARDLGARLASTNKERCIFNDAKEGPFRTQGYDGKSPFAASLMTGMYEVRTPVRIKEQPVDFGRKLSIRVSVAKIAKAQLRLRYWLHDGANSTMLVEQKLKSTAAGDFELPLWGGLLRLKPASDGVRIEPIQPPKDELSPHAVLRGARSFSPSIQIIFI